MHNYRVNEGQSLIDIAVEVYGSAEMVVKLAFDNDLSLDTDLTLNSDLAGGLVLKIDETISTAIETTTYFKLNNLNVVTGHNDAVNPSLYEYSDEEHTTEEHN